MSEGEAGQSSEREKPVESRPAGLWGRLLRRGREGPGPRHEAAVGRPPEEARRIEEIKRGLGLEEETSAEVAEAEPVAQGEKAAEFWQLSRDEQKKALPAHYERLPAFGPADVSEGSGLENPEVEGQLVQHYLKEVLVSPDNMHRTVQEDEWSGVKYDEAKTVLSQRAAEDSEVLTARIMTGQERLPSLLETDLWLSVLERAAQNHPQLVFYRGGQFHGGRGIVEIAFELGNLAGALDGTKVKPAGVSTHLPVIAAIRLSDVIELCKADVIDTLQRQVTAGRGEWVIGAKHLASAEAWITTVKKPPTAQQEGTVRETFQHSIAHFSPAEEL